MARVPSRSLTIRPAANHFLSPNLRCLISKVKTMIMSSQEPRENPVWYGNEAKGLERISS